MLSSERIGRAMLNQKAQQNPDYVKYANCMEEIKRRQLAIDDILCAAKTTTFKYTNVEFVALQFRKIFELVILSTVASHHHFFDGVVRKIGKEWEIRKVVAIVEKKNPSFYPKPITRVPSVAPGVKDDLVPVEDGYLTLADLIEAHGRIGILMHAHSPYREGLLLDEIEKQFPIWRERLALLWQFFSGGEFLGFPREGLRDSWEVGWRRADLWTWTGKLILIAGLRRLSRRCGTRRGPGCALSMSRV
ncbi:hypothetical protein V1282_005488 [Nitrobacteraceae bacterium AZCC 2146]